jgi:hypothetical protein
LASLVKSHPVQCAFDANFAMTPLSKLERGWGEVDDDTTITSLKQALGDY